MGLRLTRRKPATKIEFYASWEGRSNIIYLQILASVRSGELLSTFIHKFNGIFSVSKGYGRWNTNSNLHKALPVSGHSKKNNNKP